LVFDASKVQAPARDSPLRRVAQLVAIGAAGGVLAALDLQRCEKRLGGVRPAKPSFVRSSLLRLSRTLSTRWERCGGDLKELVARDEGEAARVNTNVNTKKHA
jgi:hypothetical protein